MAGDNSLIIRINGSAKNFLEELDKVQKKTKDLEKVLGTTAKASAIAFAGFAGSIAALTKSFADYETALIGVGKTTNIEGKKLQDFGKQFQKLSDNVPLATNELLGIAQAAGQLGVTGEKNLLKFTETVAKLGVATDLSGEQAATTLTRILNATGEGIDTIDTFGSVIVALGNNFAATESEIARMANEVARATGVFGVSAAEAAALGTAMKSVGIQAELGGSAVGKTFRTIDELVRKGGSGLEKLAKLTGVTGDQFKKTFEQDSVAGFKLFIDGLGNVVANGGSAALALEQFGLKGDEINKVLPILAKNSDLVGSALATAAKETENATALNLEAEKAFASLTSEKQKLINAATDLATEIGAELAPTIKEIIVTTRDFIKNIREMDSNLISNIASFLKWGAIISGAVAGITAFLLGAIKVSAIIGTLTTVFGPATLAASGFWAAVTGPIGIAVAGLAAVGAGVAYLYSQLSSGKKPETLSEINSELDKLAEKRKQLEDAGVRIGVTDKKGIQEIDEQVKKLEELRQAKIRASEDFGTGSLLVRPEADAGPSLGADAFGIKEQEVPFKAGLSGDDEIVKKTKKQQSDVTNVIDEETQKRIDKLKAANEAQKSINAARNAAETDEEKKLAERRAEIAQEKLAARKIENETERALALQNLDLKHEAELASIAEQEAKIKEQKLKSAEEQKQIQEILREEEVANRELLTEEDLVALEEKLLSEEEVRQNIALQRAEREIAERNQRLEDEERYGAAFAKINAFFRNEDIQNAKTASGQLIKLTNSKNETLKGIGKAAASTNAAISTAEGAIAAYKSLAGIPIVGPALGIAAAAALTAYGVEQQQAILAANTGGVVPLAGGSVGRDSIPSILTPGEIVAPDSSFDEVVEGTALARGFTPPEDSDSGISQNNGIVTVILEPAGDFIDIIERKMIEAEIQNTGVR